MKYEIFNDVLLNLREEFYRHGRFDDSNAKLDEIIKLLTLSFYEAKHGSQRFNLESIENHALQNFQDKNKIAKSLIALFEEAIRDPIFYSSDGKGIFPPNETLNINDDEDLFATKLILELGKINFKDIIDSNNLEGFDLINECFGHFVRENFRQNKEDAQYMTPKEIVEPLVGMIISDLMEDTNFLNNLNSEHPFIIMDPTCGVGTLMIETLRHLIEYVAKSDLENKDTIVKKLKSTALVGQDKVDRMARFAKINAMMMGCSFEKIFIGNSIVGESAINTYHGKVDLIISNPPFGALFNSEEINLDSKFYSFSKNLKVQNLPSELLILEKNLELLKENGKMAIVLPDSVVSAKGLQALFRSFLLDKCSLKAIIELPGVAFAQAGTRTKTVIVYLQKSKSTNNKMFMSVCNDLGYEVKERKGVPVKISKGKNEMIDIYKSYLDSKVTKDIVPTVLSFTPSCTLISTRELVDNFLTPSFYDAKRLEIINTLENIDKNKYDILSLKDIAKLDSKNKNRIRSLTSDTVKHISLLHINKDYTIDFKEVMNFDPISKGIECRPGEVLFAKLNPRIPRLTVVPQKETTLVCSNEFEILVPNINVNPYLLLLILSSKFVDDQIQALTAGTSSSHNRIKAEQLANILIPYPRPNTEIYEKLMILASKTQEAINTKYDSENLLNKQKTMYEELFI